MEKCHFYLTNGLWKIVRVYFDTQKKEQNDYFWGIAAFPNNNSFGSHIISNPWQQSWTIMNILEAVTEYFEEKEIKNDALDIAEINILRKEVNFQYTLRNYASQPFVQKLFTTYSRIQTHLLKNLTEMETKIFVGKLKLLLQMLLNECPSSAHTLLQQMFMSGMFFTNCLESLLNEMNDDPKFCSLLFCGLCQTKATGTHLPIVVSSSQSNFRNQLCLLLVASDNIFLLNSVIEEDKRLYKNSLLSRLLSFLENNLEPLKVFSSMIVMRRHFLFQILDMILVNMDIVQQASYHKIPSFIWPLILLQCWDDSSKPVNILPMLIDKCKESSKDRVVLQITFILEWYINFSEWYEKNSVENYTVAEKKTDLLEKAKDYSVLYLINKSTDLSETDWNQILELLKKGNTRTDLIKSWDIILFDGYRILIHVLNIILVSTEIYNLAKIQKTKLSEISALNEIFRSLYFDEVTGKLQLIKHMIKTMYPLNFRLEILENIFSILFINYEDIRVLRFASKVTDNVGKVLQAKIKFSDKGGGTKTGKSINFVYFQNVDKSDEDEATKRMKNRGFICKKYIIRDLIFLVKECLGKLEEDFRSQSDKKNLTVPCSINPDQMENRLDRLSENVNEASWRLQLVCDPDFVSQIGVMQYPCGQDPFHHFDNEWIFLPHENEKNSSLKTRKKSAEKQNGSGSQSQSSTGNGQSCGESLQSKQKIPSPAIVNQMLASDSSLVMQCLVQGDVLNANHIIQMMSEEDIKKQTLEGELQFTESINDLKKKLQNKSMESPMKKHGSDGSSVKSYSLQSIQMVANQGVTSTALTNHIERFLSVSTLPSIQGASKVSVGSMLQCIENAQAIVTIDLALTSDMTFQDFKGLLNIASKHCPELSTRVQSPISPQTSFSKPLGYIIFSQNIIALLQEVNKHHSLDMNQPETSLNQFLRCHQYPFSLKSLKDSISFWKQLKSTVLDYEKCDSEISALIANKEVSVGKYQKSIKEMQKIFDNVKKLLENSSEFLDLAKLDNSNGEISKAINYSDLLSRYLTDLAFFILENVPLKTDPFEPVSFRDLLEQSAVDIVDKLIFEYNVEPTLLEKKAQQLGFNLSASLIAGCCPKLPQNNFFGDGGKCPPAERIVLNELVSDYKSTEQINPADVVESTFSELLIAFQNYSTNKTVENDVSDAARNVLTEVDIIELRNDFKIQRILEKTLQLNFVSFDTLNGKDLSVLFTNLLNLMLCHCYLSTKLDPLDGVYSNYYTNLEVGYMFIGYNIGELGFVSIYDLKGRIYGEEVSMMFSLSENDYWRKIRISSDPRIAFAVTDFRSTSPRLRFYTDNNRFENEMNEAVTSYLENFVTVREGQLVVSDLLQWYLDRVLIQEKTKSFSSDEDYESAYLIMVEFLKNHAPNKIHLQLSGLSHSVSKLETWPAAEKLFLTLEYGSSITCGSVAEVETDKWKERSLSDSILRHLSQSSRVLADIVQKIHEAKEPVQTEMARDVLTEEKLKYLDLMLGAPWLNQVCPLFDNNTVISALSKCPSESRLNNFFGNGSINDDWFKYLRVLFALPDYYIFSSLNLKRLKDAILREISLRISEREEEQSSYYSQHIGDIGMRLDTVKACSKYWSGPTCISQLSSILCDYPDLRVDLTEEIRCLIRKIRVYTVICETIPEYTNKSWYAVYSSVSTSPQNLLQNLIKANQLELCLQWMNLPEISELVQMYIDSDFLLLFFNHLSENFELINQLLNSLPSETLSTICDSVIDKLRSVPLVSHLIQLLLRINPQPKYEVVAFGVRMLSDLSVDDQCELVHLVSHPILIIEQLLMNMRLDALENVLKKVREETDIKLINQNEVNELIANYASKAVEFDFVKALKNSDSKESFLLETRQQIQQEFAVPAEIPDKSQWVPDNRVSLCMCCLIVSFSMFNRRHHCRRCGRVVCSSCSPFQLKVPGYRGIAVRVCQTCYNHRDKTDGDSKSLSNGESYNSITLTQEVRYWKLSTDSNRNATIREEFSFEYIPNVSLCLAIFNLLPNATSSSILLDESEKMLKILQLKGKADNPEVDSGVVIQIIRSLIIGAKVKYGQASLTTGVVCCDRLLSQVDLLHLLIKNHYSRLIPSEPLDGQTLRYLRDKLVEEELWELAIEVSTKCGLDRNGVWAAWGKVCLTAGSLEEARVKFSYCLDSSSKPSRNPPLVDEICRILESMNSFVGFKQMTKSIDQFGTAQEVNQVLSSLKWVSQGKAFSFSSVSSKNSVQYSEQMYYLSTYGSHQGLITFFLKYEDWKQALNYLLDKQLDHDIFVDAILMPSFKNDQQARLKTEMLSIDATLDVFKKYLCHACLFLEKSDHLNILYEVQLIMQDFVRAAATCIRLYQRQSCGFAELVNRSPYLYTALRHLEEEMAAFGKKSKRLDCIMKLEPKEVNRHMNTIWRQLEVAKFLGSCEVDVKNVANEVPEFMNKRSEIATLFDGNTERVNLASLIILSGKNIAEGFGIAFRIIQDYQLDPAEVYLSTGKKLAETKRVKDIEALIECMKTSGADGVSSAIDQVLGASLPLLPLLGEINADIEKLIKYISNIDLKISILIDLKQLKSAYLLAVRHNRLREIKKIMEVADQTGQTVIKKICMKKLRQSPDGSPCSSLHSLENS